MQVVVDARLLLPKTTGIGTYLCGLAHGLRQLEEAGASNHRDFRCEFWIQPGLPAEHPIRALEGGTLSLREVAVAHMSLRQQWAVPAALRQQRPDLLHYPHFDMPWAVPGPAVATIHDLKYITRPSFFPRLGRIKRLLMFLSMVFTVRRAQRVIAVSEYTRRDIVRSLGADPEKVVVVPEGVEERYFELPSPEKVQEVRRRYELTGPFILYVGERRPHKNIVGLLRAFQSLWQMGCREHSLVIVGKRYADYDEPERLAERLPEGRVRFLGYVPDEDIVPLYRAADVFVLLSFYEGFGLPVLEAMATGTPVVAAQATSLVEVTGDGGLLVDPNDPQAAASALSRLLSGSTEREIWVQKAIAWAQRFTWQACARETVAVYREVLGG